MSTTIDTRVVEMQFDNKHFERNVSTTMSTLDKLKQRLNFTGASKGLDEVGTAAKNVNMSGLGTAVDTVKTKFSALQVMGVTALANITNSAVNAGKKIVSALTIEPVKDGFDEYELLLKAVQTTMAATGMSAEEVNKELVKLDEYADKTIYSTKDMLDNLPKFTNAGVELKPAVEAMIGIANATALAGGDASKASTAFYNLGQAIGTGYLTRPDFNSINLAGIATMEWKKQMIDAAIAAGTLKKTGDDAYVAGKKTFTLQQLFIDGLQHQWATTDVMMKVFGDYGNAQTAIGEKAYAAAQNIKTYTMMMESLKATAATGWKETWEIIFGGLDEATKFWTNLTNTLSGIITGLADARNNLLETVFGKKIDTSSWESLSAKIEEAGVSTDAFKEKLIAVAKENGIAIDDLIAEYGSLEKVFAAGKIPINIITKTLRTFIGAENKAAKSTETVTHSIKDFQKVVKDVVRGKYGNGAERVEKLTKAGYDYALVQGLVNKCWRKGKLDLSKITEEQLKSMGYTEEQAKQMKELAEEAEKTGMSLEELIEQMETPSGGELFRGSIQNIFNGIAGAFKSIGKAWEAIFPSEDAAAGLYNVLKALNEFTAKLRLTDEETGELNENGKKLVRIFKGIFAVIDIVLTVVGGPLKIVLKAITQLLGMLGVDVLDVAANIGDAIVGFRDWIDSALDFTKVFEGVIDPIKNAVQAIKDWFAGIESAKDKPKYIAEGIVKAFDTVVDFVKNIFAKIGEIVSGGFTVEEGGMLDGIIQGLQNGLGFVGDIVVELGKLVLDRLNGVLTANGFKEISWDAVAGFVNGLKENLGKVVQSAIEFANTIINKVKEILGIHSPSTVFFAIGGFIVAGLIGGLLGGSGELGTTVQEIFGNLAEGFGNIDWGKLFAAGISTGLLVGVGKIIDIIKTLFSPVEGLGDLLTSAARTVKIFNSSLPKMMKGFTKVVKNFGKVLGSVGNYINSKALMNVAISIGILVGAIILLSLCDTAKAWNAAGMVAMIIGVLGGIIIAISLINKNAKDGKEINTLAGVIFAIAGALLVLAIAAAIFGFMNPDQFNQAITGIVGMVIAIGLLTKVASIGDVKEVGKILKQMSTAMLILAGVCLIFSWMSWEGIGKAIVGLGALVGAIALLMLISKIGNTKEVGKMLKAMATSMLILAGVCLIFSMMSWIGLFKAGIGLGGLLIVVTLLMLISKIGNAKKIGTMLMQLSGAMAILAGVCLIFSMMSWEGLAKAGIALSGLLLVVTLLTLITQIGNAKKIGTTLIQLSAAMAILAGVCFLLSMMSWESLGKAAVGLLGLVGVITLLVLAVKAAGGKEADKIGNTLIKISAAIAILAVIAIVLSLLSWDGLAKGLVAVTVLSAMMALLIHVAKDAKNCLANLIVLTVAIAVMAGAVAGLSFIDSDKLATATGCMTALMGMFALMMLASKNAGKYIGSLIVMTAAIGVIGGMLYLLAGLPVENTLAAAASLSVVMLALAGVFAIVSSAGSNWLGAIVGVVGMVALIGEMFLVVEVLKQMDGLQNAAINAAALSVLMIALAAVFAIIAVAGNSWLGAIVGLVGMVALIGEMFLVVELLRQMESISNAMENTNALVKLMAALTSMLVVLAIVGPMALIGVIALGGLIGLIGAVGLMAVAIGALMTEFPQLEEFLNKGIPIMEQLAYAIGSFAGNLITGFSDAVVESLPQLGLTLSQFMVNAAPFLALIKMVDESVLAGVGIMAAAVIALTAADLIAGVGAFLSGGESFAQLGLELSKFMINALPFIMFANMIDPAAASGVKTLVEAVLLLTGANVLDSVTSWLTGGSSLADFGTELTMLGFGLRGFALAVSGMDFESVKAATNAALELAKMADTIPNEGGVVGWLAGENSIAKFGSELIMLGVGLKGFSMMVTGLNVEAVAAATDAAKELAAMADTIPNSNGVAQWFGGEKSIAKFGTELTSLGAGIKGFADNVVGMDVEAVSAAVIAAKDLATMTSAIPDSGGVEQWFTGEKSLSKFGTDLASLGSGLKGFSDEVTGMDVEAVRTGTAAAVALASMTNTIPDSGGVAQWFSGEKSLANFGTEIKNVGTAIKGFADEVAGIDEGAVSAGASAATSLAAMCNSTVNWTKITDISAFILEIPGIGKAIKSFSDNLEGVKTGRVANATNAVREIVNVVSGMQGLDFGKLGSLGDNLGKIGKDSIDAFIAAFEDATARVKAVGTSFIDGFISGMTAAAVHVTSAVSTLAKSAAFSMSNEYMTFYNAGSYLVQGFANGISLTTRIAKTAAATMAAKAAEAAKKELDEHSPSKVGVEIGDFFGIGFVNGIRENVDRAYNASTEMASSARGGLAESMNKIKSILDGDMDMNPTIRPVLDLSDIRAGAGSIGDMLGIGSSIGVMSRVGTINTMMNQRGQNGGNGEVVSAINKLNKRLNNLGNTTYNVNGVTYDDGSNISSAVQTIVRAARIERRV